LGGGRQECLPYTDGFLRICACVCLFFDFCQQEGADPVRFLERLDVDVDEGGPAQELR
jgi:hypothetical protein